MSGVSDTKPQAMHLVNLGCGNVFHPDWLNIDMFPHAPSVLVHDLRQGLPEEANDADAIYASHLIEHFERDFVPHFLRLCRKALKPGGLLRIAVPDLEQIVRLYLGNLQKALTGDREAELRRDWMELELLDQLVRRRSGGFILDYLRQDSIPCEDFIIERFGPSTGDLIAYARSQPRPSEESGLHAESLLQFLDSGEQHRWMYDRFSLARLLRECGYVEPKRCAESESQIPGFAHYHIETDETGQVRKPDSLFMEAGTAS